MTDTATASGPTKQSKKGQQQIRHNLNWSLIQTLYTQGTTVKAIADGITTDPALNKRIFHAIHKRALRKAWRKQAASPTEHLKAPPAGTPHNHPRMTTDKPDHQTTQSPHTTPQNPVKPILSTSTTSTDVRLVASILEKQKKSYLESGATLASHVLSRYSKQASEGTLPSDVEALRAIGDAVTPFHRIARDVFGLTQVAPAQVNIQVNSLSDCRLDTDVVDVE